MELYGWQREALMAWQAQGFRGIVEAVTGTGKTMIGISAAATALEAGGKVQVLVPTVELLRQWVRQVRRLIPAARVGELGDGSDGGLITSDVLVSVINSARRIETRTVPPRSLLVADECHRYGSDANARALNERFQRRLGLSATYARSDDGNARYLDPYFGQMCFRVGYARAIGDGVTARFRVALVGVRFAPPEELAYREASRKASDARSSLVGAGVPEQPFGVFMARVAEIAEGRQGWLTNKARAFLQSFTEKRRILAETLAKRQKLRDLIPALAVSERSILFTQTIDAAEDAATIVNASGIAAEALHSELERGERQAALRRFGKGQTKVLAAPQVLDEGIDVPAADLAVILAASSTRRQMIQRMGRVLRKKADGRLARFAILYVQGTSEDPAVGAHEDFLDEVTSVADEVRSFLPHASPSDICAFLNSYMPERRSDLPKAGHAVGAFVAEGATFPLKLSERVGTLESLHPRLVKAPDRRASPKPSRHQPPRSAEGRTGRPVLSVPSRPDRPSSIRCSSAPDASPGKFPPPAMPEARDVKQPKRVRDLEEARRRGMTIEQLLEGRRAESAQNLLLHEIARSRGVTVRHLRRTGIGLQDLLPKA